MRHKCHECRGSGTIKDPAAGWWKFWARVECPFCDGRGIAFPVTQSRNISLSERQIRKRHDQYIINQSAKERIMDFKFEQGAVLRDKVTGFEGVVMGRTDYFTGCSHYGLCPQRLDNDGKTMDWEWFDESRLVSVEGADKVLEEPKEGAGGPMPNAPVA